MKPPLFLFLAVGMCLSGCESDRGGVVEKIEERRADYMIRFDNGKTEKIPNASYWHDPIEPGRRVLVHGYGLGMWRVEASDNQPWWSRPMDSK